MVSGVTLPWNKSTFVVKLFLPCFSSHCSAKAEGQGEHVGECLHQVPLLFRTDKWGHRKMETRWQKLWGNKTKRSFWSYTDWCYCGQPNSKRESAIQCIWGKPKLVPMSLKAPNELLLFRWEGLQSLECCMKAASSTQHRTAGNGTPFTVSRDTTILSLLPKRTGLVFFWGHSKGS